MSSPLLPEFEFYLAHQDELVKQYDGRYIAIKDQAMLAAYDSELIAVTETQKSHELGTFLVQKVSAGNSEYSQTFHTRAVFS